MIKNITEQTGISIGVLLTVLGAVFCGTTWATRLESRVEANTIIIRTSLDTQEHYNETLRVISERLANIEGSLGISRTRKDPHGANSRN